MVRTRLQHEPRTDSIGVIDELNPVCDSAPGKFESVARICPDELDRNTDSHAKKSERIELNRVPVKPESPIDEEARRVARFGVRPGSRRKWNEPSKPTPHEPSAGAEGDTSEVFSPVRNLC
jgi:hypothetical protein